MTIYRANKSLTSLATLIALGFIWGTGYSIARFAMTNGVNPLGYSFWQSVGPTLLISTLCLVRRAKQNVAPLTTTHLRYYFICGLTGIAIPNSIMYFAAPHLPAGILAVVVNVVPIIAYPIALALRLELFSWIRLFGILLAFIGLMCITIPPSSLPDPSMTPWVLLVLLTPISFAICSIYIAYFRPQHLDNLTLSAGMLCASSLLLMPIIFCSHQFYALHYPLTTADWVIVLEIVLSSIGYVLLFQLIKIAGPVYYSLTDTIVVLTGLLWGYLLFNEKLNQWTSLAVLLILLALILVTQQQRFVTRKKK